MTSVEHNQLARSLSAASTVLLKNDDSLLPIRSLNISKIAVLGAAASAGAIVHGNGSGSVVPPYVITGLQGIQAGLSDLGGGAANVTVVYDDGEDLEQAANIAASADIAVVFLATVSGEGADRLNLSLPAHQDQLVAAVAAKAPKKTVVVINAPGAFLMPWAEDTDISAILTAFMPGQEAGNGMADILFGRTNPSGRLPLTM